jgi:hypothetical protein
MLFGSMLSIEIGMDSSICYEGIISHMACYANLIFLQLVYISITTFVTLSCWVRSCVVGCPTEKGSSRGSKVHQRYKLLCLALG